MITVFVTHKHSYTFAIYLREWSQALKGQLVIVPYERLRQLKGVRPGVVIFSDVERLGEGQRAVVSTVHDALAAQAGNAIRMVNHPVRSCRRFELLSRMHREGINTFRIHRLDAIDSDIRYPVFLRNADDHAGPMSRLIHDREQLDHAILNASMTTYHLDGLVITEYCDVCGEDGIYRKYSAFRIGDQIFPAHMLFDREWVQKDGRAGDDRLRMEETRYLEENPHREQLKRIFQIAGIEYGRIDYGIVDGRVQVWEINTNPILFKPRKSYSDRYIPKKEQLADRISSAIDALEETADRRSNQLFTLPRKMPAVLHRIIEAQGATLDSLRE